MAGRFSVGRAASWPAGRGRKDAIGTLKGLACDEEADTGSGVPGLGRPGLSVGDRRVQQAPGETWDRRPWGARPLVPDGPRLPSGPDIATAVHPGSADDLTDAAGTARRELADGRVLSWLAAAAHT
jgi:hypothetical protein